MIRNDFGVKGERPSHPGVLDWLGVEFMERGWSQKRILRTIVTRDARDDRTRSGEPPARVRREPREHG